MFCHAGSHGEKERRKESKTSAANAPAPARHCQQQDPMPEAQDPSGLIRALPDDGHQASADNG